VSDDVSAASVVKGFESVPTLIDTVEEAGLARRSDIPLVAAACELVLEALVARRKISRSDEGRYGRAVNEKRRRPGEDYFGGLSA
jgi:magnesium chelatase subunit I